MRGPAVELHCRSDSPAATRRLAARMAGVARPGDRIHLVGGLGAGKTEFAKGFAQGLEVRATIVSPSFVLMAEYRGRLPLFHLDLYRLSGPDEAEAAGLLDERQGSAVTLVEWADRLDEVGPPPDVEVTIEGAGDDPREIRLRGWGEAGRRLLAPLAATMAMEAPAGAQEMDGADR
jgi:tRNA threonylcarbamoyladenosine biosynthesis protein TsaE